MLTFDNLGEAAALERGTWEPNVPIGCDRSVTEALPWLLNELDGRGLTATFFVEAINCELNPGAVREIADRGHELGIHGWRHEPWAALARDDERALLERGREAFGRLGLQAGAFRPPGGEPTPNTPRLLAELGFKWWSPAADAGDGEDDGAAHGPPRIPFGWELVDAYHLMDRFAPLRRQRGDPSAPQAPAAIAERFAARLQLDCDGMQTMILHPFLMLDPAWAAGVRGLLVLLAAIRDQGRAWVGPGGPLAARTRELRA